MCGAIRGDLTLADRMFTCDCGHSADRDCNAAINLARWGQMHRLDPRTPSRGAGSPTPADETALTSTLRVPVKPAGLKRELTFTPHQRPEPMTPEKGGAKQLTKVVRHAL